MDKLKKLFLYSFIAITLTVLLLKILHLQNLATLKSVLTRVENQQLTIEYLTSALGKPDNDELQDEKTYNLGDADDDFNCKAPFRYISYYRGPLIIFELKNEDTLTFYFEKDGRFCYFERSGL